MVYMVLDGMVYYGLYGSIQVYSMLYGAILCLICVLLEPFYMGLALLAAKCPIYNHHLAANNVLLEPYCIEIPILGKI